MDEKNILELVKKDKWRTKILKAAQSLNLPDWWIGAGFVRAMVWDHLHDYTKSTPPTDIDVIYYDENDFDLEEMEQESTAKEIYYQKQLEKIFPGPDWSVTNQARIHLFHKRKTPYKNSTEALSEWVETAPCVGVRLDDNDELIITAPHGIYDLTHLILRPTFNSKENLKEFDRRVTEKHWLTKWPKLKVIK
ncbi:nucleotidyltransferase family protein [Patescibacteria group bacterium]|nr:nucleotidyltransferase family protein [Patescibacteria group bacterium]